MDVGVIVSRMASADGEIVVRALGAQDWAAYREVRLAALAESPESFSATLAEEAELDEPSWRARMERAPRFLAERGGAVVGTASLGTHQVSGDEDGLAREDEQTLGEVFGLWVTPMARGTGVATALARAAAKAAQEQGRSHVVYWVGTDNGRAVAFASGLGFRPADSRREMRGAHKGDEQEVAMILALGADRGTLPDLG